MTLVEAKNLGLRTFGSRTSSKNYLFNDLSFKVGTGEILLISGDNGTGKTSLVKLLLGLLQPSEGIIETKISQNQISYLAQTGHGSFFLPLTIWNVINLDEEYQKEQILKLGLQEESVLARAWNQASGGEKQKALISRKLLKPSKLIVLDEPLNHLDQVSKEKVCICIQQKREAGAAIVIISHDKDIRLFFPEAKNLNLRGQQIHAQ